MPDKKQPGPPAEIPSQPTLPEATPDNAPEYPAPPEKLPNIEPAEPAPGKTPKEIPHRNGGGKSQQV